MLYMRDAQMNLVRHLLTSKEVWDCLKSKYVFDNAVNKGYLTRKFYNLRMAESESGWGSHAKDVL